ncbi:hypothetical protein ACHAXR_004745 [Thalassiosira sp. AJA248-18]
MATVGAFLAGTATSFAPPTTAKKRNAEASITLLYQGIRERFFGSMRQKKKKLVPAPEEITQGQVLGLFNDWNDALGSGSSNVVAKTYTSDAILKPTSLNQPQAGSASIQEYFENVVKRRPSVSIVDGTITIGHNWATNVGIYEWTFGDDGSQKQARYTFVYVYAEDNEEWKIKHHHSSALPKG